MTDYAFIGGIVLGIFLGIVLISYISRKYNSVRVSK